MIGRLSPLAGALAIALMLLAATPAAAQYSYGGTGSSGSGVEGWLVFLEAGIANPRNTDNVVAVPDVGPVSPIIPDWDDEFAGRLGLGYRWSGGSEFTVDTWGFSAETRATDSGSFDFPVGPAIDSGSGLFGTTGSAFDVTTEITAQTADLKWSHAHPLTDALELKWSLGLRFASFEETADGSYSDGTFVYAVDKSNEATMFGARAGLRALYRFEKLSFGAGLGFSMLDGEIESRSSLAPTPASFPASLAELTDDSRSGAIRDLEVQANWHAMQDAVIVSLGWERAEWDDIAIDLMRNLPGTASIRDRDSVTISGFKLGLHLTF